MAPACAELRAMPWQARPGLDERLVKDRLVRVNLRVTTIPRGCETLVAAPYSCWRMPHKAARAIHFHIGRGQPEAAPLNRSPARRSVPFAVGVLARPAVMIDIPARREVRR